MITKEKYFEELKDTVLTLKYKGQELRSSPKLLKKWNEKRKFLTDSLDQFSQSDKSWIEQVYSIWYGDVIEDKQDKISNSV